MNNNPFPAMISNYDLASLYILRVIQSMIKKMENTVSCKAGGFRDLVLFGVGLMRQCTAALLHYGDPRTSTLKLPASQARRTVTIA